MKFSKRRAGLAVTLLIIVWFCHHLQYSSERPTSNGVGPSDKTTWSRNRNSRSSGTVNATSTINARITSGVERTDSSGWNNTLEAAAGDLPNLPGLELRLAGLRTFMENYTRIIETVRETLLQAMNGSAWTNITSRSTILKWSHVNYFAEVGKYPQVQTVFIKASSSELRTFLTDDFYDYSSNDCEYILYQRPKKSMKLTRATFDPACSQNISGAATRKHWFPRSYIQEGVPRELLNKNSLLSIPTIQHTSHQGASTDDAGYQRVREETFFADYIHIIRDGAVLSENNLFFGNLQLVPARCYCSGRLTPENVLNTLPIYDEVFAISQAQGVGFYHGTIENLPRLTLWVDFLRTHKHIQIYWMKPHGFLTKLLGLPASRFIRGSGFRARILYAPSGTPCGRSVLLRVQAASLWLREAVVQATKDPERGLRRDVIVLIRRRHIKRWFKHHNEILAMLKRHAKPRGLTVVEYGDTPVPGAWETGRVFGKALIVVSPHGAGEANILLSEPGTMLIEGLCIQKALYWNYCFKQLAQALGLRYHGLVYRKNCFEITAEDIEIPVAEYLNFLDKRL